MSTVGTTSTSSAHDALVPTSIADRLSGSEGEIRAGGATADTSLLRRLIPDGVEHAAAALRGGGEVRVLRFDDGGVTPEPATSEQQVGQAIAQGCAVMVDDSGPAFPGVHEVARAAERALGLRTGTCATKVSLTPPGRGFPPHLDRFDTLQLQIHGSKIWMMSSAPAVVEPLWSQAFADPLRPELEALADTDPRAAAAEASQIRAEPDSVLAVPRGHWHATNADAPSTTLIVRCGAPAALWLVPERLRKPLIPLARWRTPVYCAWGDHPRRAQTLARLDELIARDLADHGLSAAELVAGFDPDRHHRMLGARGVAARL